tara:strand:- start:254 stop:559 length:306 start_codon:yes stop_codon:yes gene_type:complete
MLLSHLVCLALVSLFVLIERKLWSLRDIEGMLLCQTEREFFDSRKVQTVKIERRFNRLGEAMGHKFTKTKLNKRGQELFDFIGDVSLVPDAMRCEVLGLAS